MTPQHLYCYDTRTIWIAIIVIIITLVVIGALWHNLYIWTNNNHLVGYIAPINESVWEHLKLIFVPFLLVGLIIWLLVEVNNFIFGLAIAMLLAMIFIIIAFYTYTGAFGIENIFIDIVIFIIAIILSVWVAYIIFNADPYPSWTLIIGWIIIIVIAVAIIGFTYHAPAIPLFTSP